MGRNRAWVGLVLLCSLSGRLAVAQTASPLEAACEALRQEHVAAVASVAADLVNTGYGDVAPGQFACVGSGTARWAQTLAAFRPTGDPDMDGFAAERRLYHVTDAGAQLVETRPIEINYFNRPGWSLRVFDFNADGVEELIEANGNGGAEWCDYPVYRLLAWQGEALVPYAPAQAFQVIAVRDVNRDDRPDLLLANPITVHDMGLCGNANYAFLLPAFSAQDGSFATGGSDEYAYVADHCPYPPSFQGITYLSETALAAVTCARYWGVPTETIAAELVRIEASAEMSNYPLDELQLAAQVTPTFVLSTE